MLGPNSDVHAYVKQVTTLTKVTWWHVLYCRFFSSLLVCVGYYDRWHHIDSRDVLDIRNPLGAEELVAKGLRDAIVEVDGETGPSSDGLEVHVEELELVLGGQLPVVADLHSSDLADDFEREQVGGEVLQAVPGDHRDVVDPLLEWMKNICCQ